MKKFAIIILILILISGGIFGYYYFNKYNNEKNIANIKKGWYVEVTTETLNIRKEANRDSSIVATASLGDIFKVSDMSGEGNYWYYIEYEDGKYGWIANPKNMNYLNDQNNPEDIAYPKIIFTEDVYYTDSIDTIDYTHLKVTDDKEGVTINHIVYHELNEKSNKDQYWIQYIATDTADKVTKKVQKIEFNTRPSESEVVDFTLLER